jgi:hypothetical protein
LNKLEKGPFRNFETFSSLLALMVLKRKIFENYGSGEEDF